MGFPAVLLVSGYTPYEAPVSVNKKSRKSAVFGRKMEEGHSLFYCYFDTLWRKLNKTVKMNLINQLPSL